MTAGRVSLYRRAGFWWSLIVVVVALVGLRLYLPIYLTDALNARLEKNVQSLGGRVGDVDLAILRGAYRVNDIVLHHVTDHQKGTFQPLGRVGAVDISVAWRDLLKGRVRVDVDVVAPQVLLEPVIGFTKSWVADRTEEVKSVSDVLVPFRINRVRLYDGVLVTGALTGSQMQALLERVEAQASEIYDSQKTPGQRSGFRMTAQLPGNGEALVTGGWRAPGEGKPLAWEADAKVDGLPLPLLNQVLLDVVPFSFTQGTATVVAEALGHGGEIEGHVQMAVEDVDVIADREKWRGARHGLYEVGGALGFIVSRSPASETSATEFSFSRKDGKFSISIGEALRSALEHRFGNEKIEPKMEDHLRLKETRSGKAPGVEEEK